MTQALKNNWQLLSWRLSCMVLIALLHNWAVASLLSPTTTISSPAGQQGQFSLAVQFAQLAPAPSPKPAVQQPVTPKTARPDTATSKSNIAKANKPSKTAQPKPDSQPKINNTVDSGKNIAQQKTALQPPKNSRTESKNDTTTETDSSNVEPQQAAQANSQAANGAHHQVVITEPVFAAPPTPPRYPTIARKRGQQGTVWLDVWLDAQGRQSKLVVTKSSGLSVLDESALKAVSQWQFQPYQAGGVRIASRVRIPVEFSLN